MSPQELWQWVHYSYGEDLGLTSSDDDYAAPTKDDEEKFLTQILTQEELDDAQDKVCLKFIFNAIDYVYCIYANMNRRN